MANLPKERLMSGEPPFTYVGVDYFGPLFVRQGRSNVKRYGCLFTCLVVRAVHIEVVHSLDNDSFINALRRFINTRGCPKTIYSDNRTNFHAGERELHESLNDWLESKVHKPVPSAEENHMEIQPTCCVTYGWSLGTNSQIHSQNPPSLARAAGHFRRNAANVNE